MDAKTFKGGAEMKKIRIERDYKGTLQIGYMSVENVWHYADLPATITTKTQIEQLVASRSQDKEYIITYANSCNFD